MSLSSLKKELSRLTSSQLVEVIADAYSARAEIKEYFEYYLNPDVNKLTEKYLRVVTREFSRTKRRYSKARVSVVNKAVKQYRSFMPGVDNEVRFLVAVIGIMAEAELTVDFTDTQWRLLPKLVKDVMSTADGGEVVELAIVPLDRLLDTERGNCSHIFRRVLKEALIDYNAEKAISKK